MCLRVIVLLCCVIYVAIFVRAHQSDQLPSQLQFYHHLLVTCGYYLHGRHYLDGQRLETHERSGDSSTLPQRPQEVGVQLFHFSFLFNAQQQER